MNVALQDRYRELFEYAKELFMRARARLSNTAQIAVALTTASLGIVAISVLIGSLVVDDGLISDGQVDSLVGRVTAHLSQQYPGDNELNFLRWGVVEKSDADAYAFSVRCKYSVENQYGGFAVHEQIFYLDEDRNIVDVIGY
ncbi:MAG: hypothetical protein V3S89_14925 [Desulfobacterales bacterium]